MTNIKIGLALTAAFTPLVLAALLFQKTQSPFCALFFKISFYGLLMVIGGTLFDLFARQIENVEAKIDRIITFLIHR